MGSNPIGNATEIDHGDQARRRRIEGYGLELPDRFELDGVLTDKWFNSLGLAPVDGELQEICADALIRAVINAGPLADGEVARLYRPPLIDVRGSAWQVARTAIFLRVKDLTKIRASVFAGLLVDLLTHNSLAGLGASVLATLWTSVLKLSDRDLEVLLTMRDLSDGKPYTNWIEQERLVDALPAAPSGEADQLQVLADMEDRGILQAGGTLWRVVL
jgi:hypothetical protein